MLVSVQQLRSYTIRSGDDEIGKLRDCYFDDTSWKVLFLVTDTLPWLVGRFVLVSPKALGVPDVSNRAFPTSLTKAQLEAGPSLEEHEPVSRQHVHDVSKYWDWPYFAPGDPRFDLGEAFDPQTKAPPQKHDDPHLRSAEATKGHHVLTPDGRCGHIDDWLLELASWTIREAVVDTTNWWPGGQVTIPCTEITSIDWDANSVHVRLNKEAIERRQRYSAE